ncbi:MAG: hypothetical protein Q7U39_03360 [Nitrospira sp.]|nr:hypothetical protein [Nitrospira sp.]
MNSRLLMVLIAMGLWLTGLCVSPLAMAVALDFNISAPTSGTISYGSGTGTLIGGSIEVDNVVGLLTPVNANVTSTCLSCTLNFTSGALSGSGGSNPNNSGWWRFGSGGSITITGGVQLQGGTDISLGSTLLTGSFNSAFVQDLGVQGFKVTFGSFSDTKHPDLLLYYGLTPGTPFEGALTLLFGSLNGGVGSEFTSTSVFSGNVVNAPVPLPGALLLFGSGLMGMLGIRNRLHLL